jgi:hypothetical protein
MSVVNDDDDGDGATDSVGDGEARRCALTGVVADDGSSTRVGDVIGLLLTPFTLLLL